MSFFHKKLNNKAQHLIEYSIVVLLVTVGIIIMGPYVQRSWNAQMKGWEDSVSDSLNEPLDEASPISLAGSIASCECTNLMMVSCSDSGPSGTCGDITKMLSTRTCTPTDCEASMPSPPPLEQCVPSTLCCTDWVALAGQCGITAINGTGAGGICPDGQIAAQRTCGDPSVDPVNGTKIEYQCQVDPICNFTCSGGSALGPGETFCPGDTLGLPSDFNNTFVYPDIDGIDTSPIDGESCTNARKCEVICAANQIPDGSGSFCWSPACQIDVNTPLAYKRTICPGDDSNLLGNAPFVLTNICSDVPPGNFPKCEVTCTLPFIYSLIPGPDPSCECSSGFIENAQNCYGWKITDNGGGNPVFAKDDTEEVNTNWEGCSDNCGPRLPETRLMAGCFNGNDLDNPIASINCQNPSPQTSRACVDGPDCAGYDWRMSDCTSTCTNPCATGTCYVNVWCEDLDLAVEVDGSFCIGTPPSIIQNCNEQACLPCETETFIVPGGVMTFNGPTAHNDPPTINACLTGFISNVTASCLYEEWVVTNNCHPAYVDYPQQCSFYWTAPKYHFRERFGTSYNISLAYWYNFLVHSETIPIPSDPIIQGAYIFTKGAYKFTNYPSNPSGIDYELIYDICRSPIDCPQTDWVYEPFWSECVGPCGSIGQRTRSLYCPDNFCCPTQPHTLESCPTSPC